MSIEFNPARRRALHLLVLGAAGVPLLAACKTTLTCDDVSSLPTADVQMRTGNGYVDAAPDPAKQCKDCNFFKSAGAKACGGCLVVKGPIHPAGTCKLWAVKIGAGAGAAS